MGVLGSLHVVPAERPDADLLAVGCFEGEAPTVGAMAEEGSWAVGRTASRPGWKGDEEQWAPSQGSSAGRVASLHALRRRESFTFPGLCRWLQKAAEEARQGGLRRLTVGLPIHGDTSGPAG